MGGEGGTPTIPAEVQRLADQLLRSGEGQFAQGIPLLEQGGADALEILQGGIPASLRPAISSATEQGRSAESAAQRQFFENLVRSGASGSEFAGQLGAQQLAGEQRVADIPTSFTLPVLQGAAGQALNLPAEGISDIGAAGQILAGSSTPGRQRGGVSGGLAGAASGAVAGASLGSFLAPVTFGLAPLAGAAVGAAAGGFLGSR